MKLQARFIFDNGELGRRAFVTGSAEAPSMGTIYDQEKDATDFTPEQSADIVARFGHRVLIEPVA